ncbi:hypothetical protein N866_18825 [Actinotalea ferrariae CF5-4]|uniref:Uncharacterized protein n=1 Tax=Actinotalea ferrariae CF5-4 TaxID=948458 RepID=A0A021VYE1_9CELL|nr:hypothetical protein [Actinotalea ferrariae]EYR65025.1 hypothetical protein N866_18825 [Actinotalea ferrariae CF5-4]
MEHKDEFEDFDELDTSAAEFEEMWSAAEAVDLLAGPAGYRQSVFVSTGAAATSSAWSAALLHVANNRVPALADS